MLNTETNVGAPRNRVDGPAKVTGSAKYAGEFAAPDLAYGYVLSGAIAKGRIASIDTTAAETVPGVIRIFTHENRPRTAWFSASHRDEVAPPGSPFRPLYSDAIVYSGQPVALVVAEELGIAEYAASLIRVEYEADEHHTDLSALLDEAYEPSKWRMGPPPDPRGDAKEAFEKAPLQVGGDYHIAVEHHNPMELHASTVVWKGDGKLTIHDKTQGAQNTHGYVTSVFGLSKDNVRVVSPFVGGAFGAGLRPQYQLFLAVMAALELERSVRVTLTRDQMFTFGYRPDTRQKLKIGADRDGTLQAISHDIVAGTSTFEDYQETVVDWSGLLYHCDNVALSHKLVQLDTATPIDMRAPGAPTGLFALETAMDELAAAAGIDPLELRLRNYSEKDQNQDKPWSSKELRACYKAAAQRFGWSKRDPKPRSMRDGHELVGWGMASGIWEALMQQTSARAVLTHDGKLEVATASADIGTGTYTILAQIAADTLGIPMDDVTVKLGDSSLPQSPVEGGSWGAASAGSAVQQAVHGIRHKLLEQARRLDDSPLANAAMEHVTFANGRIALSSDPARSLAITEVMRASEGDRIEAEATASRDKTHDKTYAFYTHSAIFAEVKVDEELGVIRVTRVVNAVAAGKILNPKTARSQIIGGVVFGIGMALEEETVMDHNLGRFMTHHLADYHVPVHADVHDIDVIFVEEHDDKISPIGVKGCGEIGLVGTAAAIANAVYHATGKRIRDLPITLDKLLG